MCIRTGHNIAAKKAEILYTGEKDNAERIYICSENDLERNSYILTAEWEHCSRREGLRPANCRKHGI